MAAPHSNGIKRPHGSWLVQLILAVVLFWGTTKLYSINLAGSDVAGYGSILTSLIGIRMLWTSLCMRDLSRRAKLADRSARTVTKTHGRARFGEKKDMKKAGLLKTGGYFIGAKDNRDVYYHGEGSIFCFGPPGSQKSVSSVMPNLLQSHVDATGRPASIFALDLKAELYAVTSEAMRRQGYNVVAVSPWAKKLSRELGIEIEDAGFNFTIQLIGAGDEAKDMAEQTAGMLLPGSAQSSESSDYFLNFARAILSWSLLLLADRGDPETMNLVEVRRLLMSSPADLDTLLAQACVSEAFGGALKQYANKLVETKINAPEEWSGAINSATKALQIYDEFGPLGKHVSRTDGFDFTKIKDRPTCVYYMIPSEYVRSHASWMNAGISIAVEQMARDRTNRRVRLFLDEFCNAGYLPEIIKSLGLYRGQGLQFIFYTQTASQVRRLYGEDGLRDFLGMCAVIQAMGVRDPETLRMLSEHAGQDTIKEFSQSLQPDLQGGGAVPGFTSSAGNQAQSLIRPEDIRTLPSDKQLVFIDNLPPMLLDKVPYYTRPAWNRAARPNPYFRD